MLAVLLCTFASAEAQVPCGATLTADTTLTSADPVVFDPVAQPGDTPCRRGGLVIGDAITLDCAGLTIKGGGSDTGLKIASGVEGASIVNCVIEGFQTGIELNGKGSHVLDRTVAINNKGTGVNIPSDFNSVTATLATKNGGVGIQIKGDGNVVDQSLAVENGKAGFTIGGKENAVSGSVAVLNGAEGMLGGAKQTAVNGNVFVKNKTDGLKFQGASEESPNSFGDNKAFANGGNGIVVIGRNADLNTDEGGNVALSNAGAVQCRIGPDLCQ